MTFNGNLTDYLFPWDTWTRGFISLTFLSCLTGSSDVQCRGGHGRVSVLAALGIDTFLMASKLQQ